MKKIFIFCSIGILLISCSKKDKYAINTYYNSEQQNDRLAEVITYIYSAPTFTKMEDRFEDKHKSYYRSLTSKFEVVKYFISTDSIHYYYVIRPSSIASERRAVGGHFKIGKNLKLVNFKEEFVTRVMTEEDLKHKSSFLFDEMVKGNLKKFIAMKHYIQWPNEVSYYDSISYEWKIKARDN